MFRNLPKIFIVLCTIWMAYTASEDIVVKVIKNSDGVNDTMKAEAVKVLKHGVARFETPYDIAEFASTCFRVTYDEYFWHTFIGNNLSYFNCFFYNIELEVTKDSLIQTYLIFAASENGC
ncbi:hypothetical protein Trydic_g21054 [Trypoxylus dichotomus]